MVHILTAILASLALFAVQYVSADAAYERGRELMKLYGRNEDLSYCYGENSICSVSNDLFEKCDAYEGDFENMNPWYECLCGNGYVAVDEACYWCQLAYKLDISYAGNANTDGCSSASVTIAPIPSSVLALQSMYNQTYTGIISGASAANTDSPAGSATAANSGFSASVTDASSGSATGGVGSVFGGGKTTSAPVSKAASSTATTQAPANTWNGGVTSVITLNGGGGGGSGGEQTGNPFVGVSPSSTLKSGGDSPGSASILNGQFAAMYAVVAFSMGLAALFLI